MAIINIPFIDQLTPYVQSPPMDDRRLTQLASTSVQGYNQLLNTQLAKVDDLNAQARRAEMVAVEAENNASLGKLLPAAMSEIGQTLMETTDKLAQIDMREQKENQAKANKAYMIGEVSKFQEDYILFQDELQRNPSSDAGKRTLEWFGKRTEEALKKAPTEEAKLDFLEKATKMKLSALKQGMSLGRSYDKGQRIRQMDDSLDSMSRTIKFNPGIDPATYLNRLTEIGNTLRQEGFNDQQVGAVVQNAKSKLYTSSVEGFIEKQQPMTALQMLARKDYEQSIPKQDFERLAVNSAKDILRMKLNSKKEIDTALGLSMFEDGSIVPGVEGASKYADLHFFQYASQALPNSGAVDQNNFNTISTSVSAYFDRYNKILGSDTKAFISDKVNMSQNPYEAAGYALAVDKLVNDENNHARRIVRDLVSNPKDLESLGNALTIGRLVRLGVDPKDAVNQVRDQQIKVNPAIREARERDLKDFLGGKNADFESMTEKMFDRTFTYYNPKNVKEVVPEVRENFIAAYKMTGDIETAKKLTEVKMKERYYLTDINGKKQIMEAAPELYFPDRIPEFKKSLSSTIQQLYGESAKVEGNRVKLNNEEFDVEIVPMFGFTVNQPMNQKTYLLKKSNGELVTHANGALATFTFGINPDEYRRKQEAYREELSKRDMYVGSEAAIKERTMQDVNKILESVDPMLRQSILDKIEREGN